MYITGNIETAGNLIINNQILEADLSLNYKLFVGGDVSMNGNVTVGGHVTVGGTVVDCSFVDSSIPASAFIGDIPDSAPDYTQPTILYEKGFNTIADVSMNANVQISNLKVDGNIQFSDGTIMDSYDDNKQNETTFKASTFKSLTITNTLTAGSFSTSSDYRIKNNVTPLDQTITIDQLRPVKYLQTLINKQQYGLIAHELQEYFPDLVKGEKDGNEIQRVNYTGLIALLINEIKRLKQELTELEKRINLRIQLIKSGLTTRCYHFKINQCT